MKNKKKSRDEQLPFGGSHFLLFQQVLVAIAWCETGGRGGGIEGGGGYEREFGFFIFQHKSDISVQNDIEGFKK